MADVTENEWAGWRAFYLMRRQLDLALERQLQADAHISAPEYELLLALYGAPGKQLRVGEIGERIGWEKSRVSHQVSRTEKRGLVERRECDSDARGVWIVLTNEGRRAVLGATRDHTAAIRRYFFDVLTEEELAVLSDISARVLDAIDPPVLHLEPELSHN